MYGFTDGRKPKGKRKGLFHSDSQKYSFNNI